MKNSASPDERSRVFCNALHKIFDGGFKGIIDPHFFVSIIKINFIIFQIQTSRNDLTVQPEREVTGLVLLVDQLDEDLTCLSSKAIGKSDAHLPLSICFKIQI